jgi:hypothetical protein
MGGLRRASLLVWGVTLLCVAWAFFAFPALVTLRAVFSCEIRTSAQSPFLVSDFEAAAARYRAWATRYLESARAASLDSGDVARTEWPMFGSVFLLVTAEEMSSNHALQIGGATREAIELAARIVVDPTTATWVQRKWGRSYLERENVFYRMLLVLGLASYERLTNDVRHASMLRIQTESLTRELLEAPLHLADDYPGECYPSDVLWAVVALERAAALGYGSESDVERLAHDLLDVLNGPALAEQGLPAFRVDASTATPLQPARGSGNSGLLSVAAELDVDLAARWFAHHAEQYWEDGWLRGFREAPRGMDEIEDVDSGPVLFGIGSVASGFGIGAARSVGRFDYAVPLAMEAVPASWPTPFGPLILGALGWLAADSRCLGELALLFSMTRPNLAGSEVPYAGGVPGSVWVFVAFFVVGALRFTTKSIGALHNGWSGARAASRATSGGRYRI